MMLTSLAISCLRNKEVAQAKEYLERVIANNRLDAKKRAEAKRSLALVLATSGDHQRRSRYSGYLAVSLRRRWTRGRSKVSKPRTNGPRSSHWLKDRVSGHVVKRGRLA